MVHPNLKDQYYDNIIDDTSLGKYFRIDFNNSAVILWLGITDFKVTTSLV